MRILIIHRSFALVGGAERVLIDKANYLAHSGHQIMLVSYEQGKHPLPYELHPSVIYVDLDCRFFTLTRYSILVRICKFFILKQKFRRTLQDKVKSFSPNVVVLASDWQKLIDAVLSCVGIIPVIAEFHNAYDYIMRDVGVSENWLKKGFSKLYCNMTLQSLKYCKKLVVLTERDAQCWSRHFQNVTVIPNPVTLYPEVIDDVEKDPGRIIFVGRFNHEKRIDRLITAFSMIYKKYPSWHVDIFGEGNEKDVLQKQINMLNLSERVVIHAPTYAIYDEYKRSEMLVLCSEHEARPLVLVEAMSCGVPCVSFDCPFGPREIINDGITGLLALDNDINDLAEKIEWMITHEKERKIMGEKARVEAAKYKMSVIMKVWEKLYTLN